jgi:hypothetical protein
MARTRSVDFLPEIFRTPVNKQFLAATLDQMVQEPKFKKTQGFIGRTVGPGVNPNDSYVVEPDKTRQDYQLEPGIVNLKPDTDVIDNVITYPGINDAIGFQGGDQSRPDLLYNSDYYTWDPFVDYDSFVNFSQYFWLPQGPLTVDIETNGVPITDNFVVTRENGVYTFSGQTGNNPTIDLVRGGNYTFQVAQNVKETVNYRVTNNGITSYQINFQPNPTLTLVRGNTYVFNITLSGVYPFWIKTALSLGTGDAYNSGVLRNGSSFGLVTFTVPQDAPNTLYYVSENQTNLRGTITVVDGTPGTGPGFWIQTSPGVDGKNPISPNLSDREIFGVTNNGEDLGLVYFEVPQKTAQQFYYNLTDVGPVDLLSTLQFDQINNQPLDEFIATYNGIDGTTYLDGRTLVFTNTIDDAEDGGWLQTTFYDPLFQLGFTDPAGNRRTPINIVDITTDLSGVTTLDFASELYPPLIGDRVRITGVTPSLYNGDFVVTASSGTSISVINTQATPVTNWPLPGGTITVYGNYNSVSLTSVTGTGTGALLNVNLFAGSNTYNTKTEIQVVFPGTGYTVGDTLKITGDQIGGATPANDLTLVVASITDNGSVGSFDTTTFDQTITVPIQDRYQVWQINIVDRNGTDYISLTKISDIGFNQKFTISYGITYSNTSWYKNSTGYFQQIPALTAVLNELYYQDGTDSEIFGRIRLLDQTESFTIFIDQIIGKQNYTSPNGVVFTNGLKVRFTGDVYPASYGSGTKTVSCVSTIAGSNYITCNSTTGLYEGEQVIFSGTTAGGIVAGETYYIKSISANGIQFSISTVEDGATFALTTANVAGFTATAISNNEYYVAGVGTAIELLPVRNFICPETYVEDANDSTIASEPDQLDYLTIDRASKDLNAWTRSNRWFHVDVIQASASYNNTVASLDNNYRAKRPIISFRPDIRLYNMGTQGKQPVDIIDFEETDAFSNIEGSTGYSVDGYTLVDGSRVIFAADQDPDVRNKIYVVQFITPDSVLPLIVQPIIHLVLADDGLVLTDQSTVCLEGNDLRGLSFWYDGVQWSEAQQKNSVQQAPLFNVYDLENISFGNRVKYPSSTFVGSKLFSYAVGDTSILDPILQFPLQYLNINNVGDIVFDNNLYLDTFLYVRDNVSITSDISSGAAREYVDRTTFNKLIGWQNAISTSQQYQQFKFTYTGKPLKLDVAAGTTTVLPVLKIYVGSEFILPSQYTYDIDTNSTTITLSNTYLPTDVIEVLVLSDQTSTVGFYQVPINLESNPLNGNSPGFTLGTIRTQYETICENLKTLSGPISGANNTRDLGNLVPYGSTILQQSAPLTFAGYFLRSEQYNIFASLQYNSQEYLKFKGQMLNAVTQQTIQFETTSQVLDTAIESITLGKVETQPFYWSDMIPAGAVYTTLTYQISNTTNETFDTRQVYNYTSANYLGMNVYLNDVILTRDRDYVVATDGPRITVLVNLTLGDVLLLQEYTTTYGSFVPNTPTKLGLYPAWRPEIITQKTSSGTQTVIIGHDGSVTKTFDDIRDDVLLEFETRIFNNLKLDGNPVPLTVTDVLPGQFRNTGYSADQINNILSQDFLSYVAWNKLDYKTQNYSETNEFTWNYSGSQSKLDNSALPGAWRGIYRYYYDTQQPQQVPWEMLGFTIKPDWWEDNYGPGPYTQDNLVLWDDLEAGYVADPIAPYYLPAYARSGLTSVIPTGTEGALLSPFDAVVGTYNDQTFRKSWALGDGGPVEASWWNSSAYPFAAMRLLALTRPAKFFALFADRDLYKYNTDFDQYLYNNRYRLNAKNIEIYGNGVSKASYIDWIVDYNRQTGIDSTTDLAADLDFIDVRLCYRMASFSDKQYIKIYTEKSSPNSINTTFLIPDESYNLVLYKNQPFDRASYSSVIIQKTSGRYAVFGYSTTQPYFNVQKSVYAGKLQTYSSGGTTVQVPTLYSDTVESVPYGFIFSSETAVADFLLSYGQFLERQGLEFTDVTNGYILNWGQMVNEFLYWSQQGWDDQALINLNPLAFKLSVSKAQAVVDSIAAQTSDNILLDQNRNELPTRNLIITRIDNTFTVEPASDQTLSYIDLKYTSYEHMIVLNNTSAFGDLIYNPITGARQSRLNLVAVTTTEWNGSVDAQGFILNQNNIEAWDPYKTYAKGEIVTYKGSYWSAADIVQPSKLFNANNWYQSDYTRIELGLLPNLANKANQLQNSYNINTANLESDNDLLSYGLIGFRPRQYMSSLNLDDVSQVNIYRQFLGSKGTILSAELFSQANLGKESADYDIYENWAVQRAVYGANANRSFFQLRLNRALLDSNPSLVQIINPQEASLADQTILVSDIWRESYNITSPDILPVTTTLPTDIALPTAGYVNLDDVDITVFDINNTTSLEANINSVGVGTNIWVAKINSYDWAIYRSQAVPGTILHVCDNLDGTSLVIFSGQHGLKITDKLIIRFFDAEVNGVYTVLTVPALDTVTIAFSFTGDRTVVNGIGLGFTLQTQRVNQASDILTLPYANTIKPGAKVWVDNNGADLWTVLQKEEVFTELIELSPTEVDQGEQYGSSVAQARNKFAALVGSPQYRLPPGSTLWNNANSYDIGDIVYVLDPTQTEFFKALYDAVPQGTTLNQLIPSGPNTGLPYWTSYSILSLPRRGAVYVYVKNDGDVYTPISPLAPLDSVLSLDIVDVSGGPYNGQIAARNYGTSVDFGNQTWAAAGAPGSLGSTGAVDNGYAVVIYKDPQLGFAGSIPYGQWQLLTSPNSTTAAEEFGYSVAVSLDERWLYVGAPGANSVYAYGRVDWEKQLVQSVGDGVTTDYVIGNIIQIDVDTQLTVSVAGDEQILGTDYTVTNLLTTVEFTSAPNDGAAIEIIRTSRKILDYQTSYDVVPSATSGAGTGAEFTVSYIRNKVGQPAANAGFVEVSSGGQNYSVSDTITLAAASFGGNPTNGNITLTVSSVNGSGAVLTFTIAYTPSVLTTTFSLNEYLFTADNINSFTVLVDNVLQRPNIDYTFSTVTGDVTFVAASNPAAGATIFVRAEGYFLYSGTISNPASVVGDRFGRSVSTSSDGRQILIGADKTTVNTEAEAGTVYVYDRDVQRFIYNSDNSTIAGYQFTVLGSVAAPVSVLVNGTFLVNETDSLVNSNNTFTVSGNTITINGNLQTGDIVEIETNDLQLVQTINQDTVAEFSNYGYSIDLCSYNCSLYVGAPNSGVQTFKGGAVERQINQSRAYGIITGLNANPNLDNGDTIRINNQDVVVPAAWTSASIYAANTVVYNTNTNISTIYSSLQPVPAGILLTNTSYWKTVATTAVVASAEIRALAAQINIDVSNVNATVDVSGYLTLAVKNSAAAPVGNKLQVAPGSVGTTFDDIGFDTFVFTQTIVSPYPADFAGFGTSVSIDDSAINLVVGAPRGTLYLIMVFDQDTTIWDEGATDFFDQTIQSGAVYTYDLLSSSNSSVSNPDKFVFGQQIDNPNVASYDQYGTAVNYTSGVLFTGAPGNEFGDSTMTGNYGRVFVSINANQVPAWTALRTQQPTVDIRLLNSVYSYDRLTSATGEYFDFFDPLQGKILGAARQNIDFIGAVNPASYNVGPENIRGTTWGADRVGETWWDTSTVRFIDPNQGDIVYASRRWSQVFPGSTVDVYQWIVSPVPPSTYTGEGVLLDTLSYVVNTVMSDDGIINTEYYFWVKGLTSIATQKGKTLSVSTVSNYIESPRSSGIAYIAPINSSTIALYNALDYIQAEDTILSIEFDKQYTDDNVHVEYELITQGKADGWLSTNLYRKLQDSFCGVDTAGNLVPDINLGVAERYGVQFRPRQSMFVDRFAALKNYLTRANDVLARYPISESKEFNLLNSSDPEPNATTTVGGITTVNWNKRVANLEILEFQNIYDVDLGYKYLVQSDSNNRGLWTIYEVIEATTTAGTIRELTLARVQNYDTKQYWSYINWYLPGYNTSSKIIVEVPNVAALNTLDVAVGSSVKVTANGQGKFEIYLKTITKFDRVALEDGTIEFSSVLWDYALGRYGFDLEVFDAQYFDQEPVIETRKIIQAINEELFIDDLLIERNRALTLMFNFVLSEFSAPEWLVKTSLVDVVHRIRSLQPFQNYSRDNQEFVLDYIQEVKPYHVQIREFNLIYNGFDEWAGDMTDFDLPAYYNTDLQVPQYTSPILLPYDHGIAFNSETNNLSDLPANSTVWDSWPYSQWFSNYLLNLDSIALIESGSGYTEPPLVIITPNANDPAPTVTATATAILNSLGQVSSINVTNAGAGYRSTPTVTFDGGNGSGAVAYPRMVNDLVRQFRTVIKYDRFQYQTAVLTWSPDGTYENGTLVRYDGRVWSAQNADGSSAVVGPTFDLENWTLVNAATYTYPGADPLVKTGLTGVDRTMGLYVPGVNEYGLELPLLVDGVSYPGVQVWGDYFAGTQTLDANYQSEFADIYLGTGFSDINVDGGEFIGPYEGHAPEELINGAEYDTLDMRIYTRPGADWTNDGHGFQIGTIRYTYQPGITTNYSWANVVETPFQIIVSNLTSGLVLTKDVDYTIDWVNQTIEIITLSTLTNDIINIDVYEIGGGSQLFKSTYLGIDVLDADSTIIIPVSYADLQQVYIFVNGELVAIPELEPYSTSIPWDQNVGYQSLDIVFNNNQIVCTATSDTYDTITCDNTSALTIGQPIVFSGTVFGGIVAGQEYYVYNIANSTQFFISDVAGATSQLVLSTGSGTMTGSPQGTYYRAIKTVPAGIELTDTLYWLPFVPTLQTKVTVTATLTVEDELSLLALGDPTSLPVTKTLSTGNAITLLGSTSSLSVGQQLSFSGYSLGGIDTGTVYEIFSIINGTDISITQDGVSEVQLIDDQASWTKELVAKFEATDFQSWSTPVIESFIVDNEIITNGSVTLDNVPQGTNAANMVVMINGLRVAGPACIEWIGDGTTNSFGLPQRLGTSFLQSSINAPNDILVWVDNVLQKQLFGAETSGTYTVTNWDGSNTPGRQVVFSTNPPSGAKILIAVTTLSDCVFAYNPSGPNFTATLELATILNINDRLSVITWNDTAEQNALTLSFVGPVETGITIIEPYDSTDYDVGLITGGAGTFDYSVGTSTPTNDFNLLRDNVIASRLWVTLDGVRLFEGEDYTVQGEYLILSSGAIGTNELLMVTEFTNSAVPEAAAFRIFQDMRGVQATYRITKETTTELTQVLTATADIIHVENASALTQPDLPNGRFGIITIDGERIMYRYRNTVENTVSGLQRGTAGTAADSHQTGAAVYDISQGNLLNEQYQDYMVKYTGMGDGTTTLFYAVNPDGTPIIDNVDLGDSSTTFIESIEVYVGGVRQYNYSQTQAQSQYRYIVTDFDPLAIEFIVDNDPVNPLLPPAAGSEVTILQRRGLSWYQPGVNTASNGVALQETDTQAARFLCNR